MKVQKWAGSALAEMSGTEKVVDLGRSSHRSDGVADASTALFKEKGM